jgi:glyoxylase-like metal-dependent hydrolase (beta-lactamase superfamily II)/rhodanese-related sulfurtransferase
VLQVDVLETPSLGDRSYLVSDGDVAVMVDPQRDLDRVLPLVERRGVRLTHVLETHLHNDYVTGGRQLAGECAAEYVVPGLAVVDYPHRPAQDGDVVETGSMRLRVLHTPGHTPSHVSYALEYDGVVTGAFTGGSMLFGSTGRPDLSGSEHTAWLAAAQHRSVRRLSRELPPDAQVFPTHGFGSFCSSGPVTAERSTVAEQRDSNPALTHDESTYVAALLAGLGPYPAYFAHMAGVNAAGPAPWSPSRPTPLDEAARRRRVEQGGWVLDVRGRRAFASGHLPGTLGVELADGFATYAGWLLPWGSAITLVGDTQELVATAQRDLARIGFDDLTGAAVLDVRPPARELRSYRVADFAALAVALRECPDRVRVLDVRRTDERAAAHVTGSWHVPVHELPGCLDRMSGPQVWVYCASGYRASIAASLLDRHGCDVVLVDDPFENADVAGVPVTVARAATVGAR